ncbi:hypothetical protein F2P44_33425 [Massilia sp. CCM 8695]|uniref:Uncharacterized protein n=1 Tax=Massilia frigida TaxID=2609281 RepID=A0ABX0NKH3_9BURK|nr:hypothetical protein [Massilia frigida]NHZ84120.1 hypothetical protein [Massilia frigida]
MRTIPFASEDGCPFVPILTITAEIAAQQTPIIATASSQSGGRKLTKATPATIEKVVKTELRLRLGLSVI